MEHTVVDLAKKIISIASVSPDHSGVQDVLIEHLRKIGFAVEERELHGCKNFWARCGEKAPLIVFSGHSDVVAAGDERRWASPPFEATVRDNNIFGRGAADMKCSIAAAVVAVESLAEAQADWPFSVGFLITGDEEIGGKAAETFLEQLEHSNQKIDYCIVLEPSSESKLGDTVKIGRRGSLSGSIEFIGRQGHVGYPHLAENALHRALKPLAALTEKQWDDGGEFFQPTTFQLTHMRAGIADNVIPGESHASFNFRFSTLSTFESLKTAVEQVLRDSGAPSHNLTWDLQAEPFLTARGPLTELVTAAIEKTLGVKPVLSTAGGTSDARFFAKKGIQVLELGPINKTIHQTDEHVGVADLIQLSELYRVILDELASKCS